MHGAICDAGARDTCDGDADDVEASERRHVADRVERQPPLVKEAAQVHSGHRDRDDRAARQLRQISVDAAARQLERGVTEFSSVEQAHQPGGLWKGEDAISLAAQALDPSELAGHRHLDAPAAPGLLAEFLVIHHAIDEEILMKERRPVGQSLYQGVEKAHVAEAAAEITRLEVLRELPDRDEREERGGGRSGPSSRPRPQERHELLRAHGDEQPAQDERGHQEDMKERHVVEDGEEGERRDADGRQRERRP